ncbi:MAG: metallophosphoesterase [Lachnospiraceae bacterium]|nr:metallophosphoesterase [Lachnospiraceae bacterium]MDD6192620.1 metallophosphoesterase [Lachnospiraceae bacterium]MDY4792568.1 metallophosphoesterase [Pararoseburia sp.]
MKIIHCADLHLDSKMESNLDRDAAALRREELLDTFQEMVEYAAKEQVRVIIIAGDLFDKQNVRKTVKNRVVEQIQMHPEIDFCYIRGNHDQSDVIQEMVEQQDLPNLKLFDSEAWTSYDYEDVVITGIELVKENAQTLGMNLVLDQNRLNIVVLHGQESDYQGKDKTEVVNLSLLRNKYIDYLALGHIHSFKLDRLDDRGVYCYCGCLEGRGFDECGDKGFVLLETEQGKIKSTFVPMAKRRLHEVTVEVTPDMSMPQMIEQLNEKVKDISGEDLIKIILTGETDMETDIDVKRLMRGMEKDFFYVKCYDKTTVAVDYDSFRNDKSLKGEFVRLMEQQHMSESERAAIIELGIKAIMGEELEV